MFDESQECLMTDTGELSDENDHPAGSEEDRRNPFHHLNSPARGASTRRNEDFGAVLVDEGSQNIRRRDTPPRSRRDRDNRSPPQRGRNETHQRDINTSFYAGRGTIQQPVFVRNAPTEVEVRDVQLFTTPPRAYPSQSMFTALNCNRTLSAAAAFYPSSSIPAGTLPVASVDPGAFAIQVSPFQPRRNFRASTDTSTASVTNSKGRKKSWWVLKCFVQIVDENMEMKYVCRACKTQKSGKQNASRLAEHLWQCPLVDERVKRQLHEDSVHIRSVVKRYSGESQRLASSSRGDQPPTKKRRLESKPLSHIEECTEEEADDISMKIVRSVIEFCFPLSIFDSPTAKKNSFREAFLSARPGYRDHFPSRHLVMVKYLPRLYNQTEVVVKRSLKQLLSHGYGTIIFDGWDDLTKSSVVNVLLRVEAKSMRKTFFLDSVFTGHARVGATEYVRIIERVMGEYGGLRRICGVASDSARACVNARNALSEKYRGLIGIQDQAHVADLLMKDIGKLAFVKDVLDKVNLLAVDTKAKKKLLHFVKEEIKRENERIRQEEQSNGRPNNRVTPSDPLHPDRLFPPLRKTAVMLRKPATTRFASFSDTLEAFIRTRRVLVGVIAAPEFERDLFTADNSVQEERRDAYKALVSSASFLESVKEIHNVFRLCRRYLRVFDKEAETSVADVVHLTDFLGEALQKVPTSQQFLTEERLAQIIAVFKRRKDGPVGGRGIQVRLVEDVHVAARLLHPSKFPRDYAPYSQRFYAFLKRYVDSLIKNTQGESEETVRAKKSALINKILNDYEQVHTMWTLSSSEIDSDENRQGASMHYEAAYRASPLRFWAEEARLGSCPELCELALRTLSISTSSCAAERSFSTQGRIKTKLRNRLNANVVRKMMFIKWNIRHYDESEKGSRQALSNKRPSNLISELEQMDDGALLSDADESESDSESEDSFSEEPENDAE